MINTRDIAYKILYDVKYNKKYSNICINNCFKSKKLNYEQRGFVTYLVYGVLSKINYLDYFIKKYSDIAFSKISKQSRIILEMALFELIFMDSSLAYASVNESVNLAKKYDNRAKKFINALLRKFCSNEQNIENLRNYDFEDIKDEALYISTKYSLSLYIAKRLLSNYGKKFTQDLMIAMGDIPSIFIRANVLKTNIDDFTKDINNLSLEYDIIDYNNMIFKIKNFKDIADNDIYKQGKFSVQDYASMLCVLSMDIRQGQNVLDICSAPGGKSIMIAQLMKNNGNVISLDISKSKLNLLKQQALRLGIDIIKAEVNDAILYKDEYNSKFDRVLCDVPCLGLGILRRKPEIRYKSFDDIDNIISTQKKILYNSSLYLKKSGILVYSTCSLGREENDDIIDDFLRNNANFNLVFKKEYYPHIDETDGFFIAKMVKNN